MNREAWCDRVIRWGFYLLFILVPLILTPWNYELFEYNKMMVTYGLTAIIVTAWLVKMIAQKEIRIAKTPLDIPILLFLSSQLISSLFSMDPHVSWFGYYSRFNGGMWSIVSYVLLYYAFVSNFGEMQEVRYQMSDKKNNGPLAPQVYHLSSYILHLLKIALATAAVVALYGVLERLGIDKHLWVQDVQNRVFSSLGQPNWLAAYLVALSPIAWAFALQNQKSKIKNQKFLSFGFWIWSFIAALFFLVLLFTRSRSGLLGFAVADVVFWGLLALKTVFHKDSLFSKQFAFPFLFLHASFFLIIFFNGTYIDSIDRWFTLRGWQQRFTPQSSILQPPTSNRETSYTAPLLETGGTESSVIRKYVWQGAVNAWKSSSKTFLIGTGTETFAFAFYQSKPVGHNLTSEWDFLYNKAHNEYLNYLATTGIFGLGSYLLLLGSFIFWFLKTQMSKLKDQTNVKAQRSKSSLDLGFDLSFGFWILKLALFAGWISILVTNFFGFSVVIVQLFLFLFPAMAIVLTQQTKQFIVIPAQAGIQSYAQIQKFLVLLVLLALLVLLFMLSRVWWADVRFAQSYRLARAGQYTAAQPAIVQAIQLNPAEPFYRDEAATTFAALATLAAENKQATLAATLAKQALEQSDRAITVSPKNVNFWKSRTKVFYTFTAFDQQFNPAAVAALQRASKLSPNDPKILYNLAILYGRQNDNARAVQLLETTVAIKPNYRDAYFALHIFYKEVRNEQKAREILQKYLDKVDPNDKDFQSRL